jgi:hypothetical protein
MAGRTRQNASDMLGFKTDLIDDIETSFRRSFTFAGECVNIGLVLLDTNFEFRMAGRKTHAPRQDRTWQRARATVMANLKDTRERCERYLDVEPLARIVELKRYVDLAILHCQRCCGPEESDENFICKALESLSALDKSGN